MFSLVKSDIPQDYLAWIPSHSQTHSFKKSLNACYVPGTIMVTEGPEETYTFNIYFQRELFEVPSQFIGSLLEHLPDGSLQPTKFPVNPRDLELYGTKVVAIPHKTFLLWP